MRGVRVAKAIFRRSRAAAALALLAIWLQALLPAVHHPAGVGIGGGLNLCFAPGTAPARPAPAKPAKAPAHHVPACPLCRAIHAIGAFAPPASPSLPAQPVHPIVLPGLQAAWVAPCSCRTRPRPRAPPLA
jgi:hypothetical protein